MNDTVRFDVADNIAQVRLNRPDTKNAVNGDIMDALRDVVGRIESDKTIRVVVLSGEGGVFSSGLDFSNFENMLSGDLSGDSISDAYNELTPYGANVAQQVSCCWQMLSVPVIAAIEGAALGAGLQMAMGADIRVAHPQAKLGFVECTFGLLPDMGGFPLLKGVLNQDRIKDLLMTGRVFRGEQGYDYGVVTELSETPLQRAMDIAETLRLRNPDSLRAIKRITNDLPNQTLRQGLKAESDASRELLGSANQLEAVMSKFEGREPNFS